MSEIVEIASGIHWVGAKHPELEVFDDLFPTHNGTTYNSYLVRGSVKTALIDTVKAPFTEAFLAKVEKLLPLEQVDVVVINHTEPDHSGALAALLERNPNITVYITKAGENFLKQLINAPFKAHVVADGEELDLGGRTLRFVLAPYLHWPDTMFTYLVEDQILFPCDAFGAHYCATRLFDDEIADFSADFHVYFDCIMRPFKDKALAAIAKIRGERIEVICPSHGPVLRSDPWKYIGYYEEWCRPKNDGRKIVIFYLSPHHNTEKMAAAVAKGAAVPGVEPSPASRRRWNTVSGGSAEMKRAAPATRPLDRPEAQSGSRRAGCARRCRRGARRGWSERRAGSREAP